MDTQTQGFLIYRYDKHGGFAMRFLRVRRPPPRCTPAALCTGNRYRKNDHRSRLHDARSKSTTLTRDQVSRELKSAGQLLLLRHCCISMQRADPSHFTSISFEIGQFANESRAEDNEGFCQRPPLT